MCTDVSGTAATAPSEAVFVTGGCGSVWGSGGAGPEQECCGGGAHLLPRRRCHVSILSAPVNALENRFSSKRQVAQVPLRQLGAGGGGPGTGETGLGAPLTWARLPF